MELEMKNMYFTGEPKPESVAMSSDFTPRLALKQINCELIFPQGESEAEFRCEEIQHKVI